MVSKLYLIKFGKFSSEGFTDLNVTRFEIFKAAAKLIILNPLIGTGEFIPIIYEIQTGFWKGHSHNIFSDLSLSYGIPSTLILILFLFNNLRVIGSHI